jgi:hypothetical protein
MLGILLLGHAAAWPRAQSFLQVDVPAECGCDCCNVIARRPTEVENGVHVECAPDGSHDCSDQCSTSADDAVLRAAGDVMDLARYCFFECKPARGWAAPLATACVSLSKDDRRVLSSVKERSGNAVDPAVLKRSGLRPAAFLQLQEASHPTIEATTAVAGSTRDQAADTRAVAKDLRDKQVKKAQEIKNAAEAPDPLEAIRSILADTKKAKEAAQNAQMEAGDAEAAVLKARKSALEGGIASGKSAMEEVKAAGLKATHDLAEFRDKMVNKQELKAIGAAAKASEPWMLDMLRAQKTVADYTSNAQANAGKAASLQAEAKSLADQANAAGDPNAAKVLYAQAQDKAAEAKETADRAKSLFATADELNKEMPKYQGAAQAAAAKAAFDSMPAWQPAALAPFPDYAKR